MELANIAREIYESRNRLNEAGREVYRLGIAKAETERIYRMELSKTMFLMRNQGIPATIMGDLARGEIAELKFNRDLAAEKHRAAFAAMEALKVDINALQSILRVQSEV